MELCGRSVFARDALTVSCDFEKGLLKALGRFPCSVKCCQFHMSQSIWRFVSKRGLQGRYRSDAVFRKRVRSLMTLPLLPTDVVKRAFKELRPLFAGDTELMAVYQYYADVWMKSFPVELWCQYDALFHTNNFAEAFHSVLSRRSLQIKPQFYVFVWHITDVIAETREQFETHRVNPKPRTWRLERLRTKLRCLVENYMSGPPLALPLDELLAVLFGRLHERVPAEELFADASPTICDSPKTMTLLSSEWNRTELVVASSNTMSPGTLGQHLFCWTGEQTAGPCSDGAMCPSRVVRLTRGCVL